MRIQGYLSNVKAWVHQDERSDDNACTCRISNEKILRILNKFLKDKLLCLFMSDFDLFDKSLNLADFYLYFDKDNDTVINLELSHDIKKSLRKILQRDNLTININLI